MSPMRKEKDAEPDDSESSNGTDESHSASRSSGKVIFVTEFDVMLVCELMWS